MNPFRLLSFVFLLTFVGYSARAQSSLQHDVGIIALYPPMGFNAPIGFPYPVSVTVSNRGQHNEENVKIIVFAIEKNGPLSFRDTIVIPNFETGRTIDTTFPRAFIGTKKTSYNFTAICMLTDDEDRSNDTSRGSLKFWFLADLKAVSVIYPHDDEAIVQKTSIKAIGTFINNGSEDFFEAPLRIQIRRASDNVLVFQADSLSDEIDIDSPAVKFTFPSQKGNYDTKLLPIGKYKLSIIGRQGDDGDRSNDTVSIYFSIVSGTTTNDVGVEQVINPEKKSHQPIDQPVEIKARFRNNGSVSQTNITVKATVTAEDGTLIFSSGAVVSLAVGTKVTISFQKFNPKPGVYTCRIFSCLPNDEYRYDDTVTFIFSVGIDYDRTILSILDPYPFKNVPFGTPITPTVVLRNIGAWNAGKTYIKARIFSLKNSMLVYEADTSVESVDLNTREPLKCYFPSMQKGVDTKMLPSGFYKLQICYRETDDNRSNDTMSINFQIGIEDVITNVGILDMKPLDSARVDAAAPFTVSFRCYNSAKGPAQTVPVTLTISNRSGVVVHRETISLFDLGTQQFFDTAFTSVIIGTENIFTVTVASELPFDGYTTDNTLRKTISTFATDINVVSIIKPSNGQRIKAGTYFSPQCVINIPELFVTLPPESAKLTLCDSITDEIKYSGYTTIPLLYSTGKNQTITIPASMPGLDFSNIAPGSYKLYCTIADPADNNTSNNTASTYFAIYQTASTRTNTYDFMACQNYPNPFTTSTTFTYSLPEDASVTIAIIDVTGRNILQLDSKEIESAGTHTKSINFEGLSGGTYIAELTFKTSTGGVKTKRIPIQHLQ